MAQRRSRAGLLHGTPLTAFVLTALAAVGCSDADAPVAEASAPSRHAESTISPQIETSDIVGPIYGDECTPGETEVCYDGPDGTLGVGACQAGVRTCNAYGTGWGYCIGQVKPFTEECTSTVDLDCNGYIGCKPGHLWSQVLGDASSTSIIKYVDEMTTDASGNVLLTGQFRGTMTIGSQVLMPSGRKTDAYLLKLDPSGAPLWARNFGGVADDFGRAVTTDAAGNIYLAGMFNGTVDFGTGPLVSAGSTDLFVVKLDSNGNTIWSQRYGGLSGESPDAIGVSSSGAIVIAGRYTNALDFGLGPLPTSVSTLRTFVLSLDASGAPVWSRGFDVAEAMAPHTLSLDTSGDVVVVGYSKGWVNFGSGPVTPGAGLDGFAVRLSGLNGSTVWSKLLTGPAEDRIAGVAHDGAGHVVLAGWISGPVNLGGATTLSSAGNTDIMVAKLDAATGAPVWGKTFGNPLDQAATAVEIDTTGNIVLLGHHNGNLDLGDGLLTSPSDFSISRFLAKLDSSGNLLWSLGHHFQTYSTTYGRDDERALALDPSGNVLFSGTAINPIDYGGGPIGPVGSYGFVIAKYAP